MYDFFAFVMNFEHSSFGFVVVPYYVRFLALNFLFHFVSHPAILSSIGKYLV